MLNPSLRKNDGAYCSGEGGRETAVRPRFSVPTTKERLKKGEDDTWDDNEYMTK